MAGGTEGGDMFRRSRYVSPLVFHRNRFTAYDQSQTAAAV